MPGTSRLVEKRLAPSSVLVCVNDSELTVCQRPCTRVMEGRTVVSLVSRSLISSKRLRASTEKRSSAGSPMGMS